MKLETATIRRLRDALLQSGRKASAIQSSAFETLTREGLLSREEIEALERVDPMAETMFLVMAADGTITREEREALFGAVRGLTDNLLQDGTIRVMLERYRASLESEGREARLQKLGSTFAADKSEAESAFALAAAVAVADEKLVDAERELIQDLAKWFGIAKERVTVILDEIEQDRAGRT